MRHKVSVAAVCVAVAVVATSLLLAACGSEKSAPENGASESASPSGGGGKPFKLAFLEGFTGFMAIDAQITDQGIQTALEQVNYEVLGRKIDYIKADDASDPVQAVDKARQLVEGQHIDAMIGPIFSPAAAAVYDFLGKEGGVPSITPNGHPKDNLKTANGLAVIPNGMYSSWGYYLGQYCSVELGYKTANCISYEDTTAHQCQAGFAKGFAEGGGKILSDVYTDITAVDFSSYLTTMKPADCTYWWIFGNGAAPFVKQYHDYGLRAPLVTSMFQNLTEAQLADLGPLGEGLIGVDCFTPETDNDITREFVAKYREMWNGEYPPVQAFQAWQAVHVFLEAVKKTNGDTTPAKLLDAMSTLSFETPAGKMTLGRYRSAIVGTGNFFVAKSQKVGDRYAWVPVKVIEQVPFHDIEDM